MVNIKFHTELNRKRRGRRRIGRSSRRGADCINISLKEAECESLGVDSYDRVWGSLA
jgi:hypothetical protein